MSYGQSKIFSVPIIWISIPRLSNRCWRFSISTNRNGTTRRWPLRILPIPNCQLQPQRALLTNLFRVQPTMRPIGRKRRRSLTSASRITSEMSPSSIGSFGKGSGRVPLSGPADRCESSAKSKTAVAQREVTREWHSREFQRDKQLVGFRDRKETDFLQLICSVNLIAKRSGFSRTRTTTSTRTTPQIRNLG